MLCLTGVFMKLGKQTLLALSLLLSFASASFAQDGATAGAGTDSMSSVPSEKPAKGHHSKKHGAKKHHKVAKAKKHHRKNKKNL